MRNKTNVRYVKIHYESFNGDVKCNLTYEVDIDKYPLNKIKLNADDIIRIANKVGCEYIMFDRATNYPVTIGFNVTAMARCNDDTDLFNFDKGKHISLTRAQAKAFERTCHLYAEIEDLIDGIASACTTFIYNNWEAGKKCWAHAAELGEY